MQAELAILQHNNTWILTPLPPSKKAIGSKWVYKLKLKPNGDVDRFKARLVAKGYNQVAGLDYSDYFATTAKVVTVRILFIFASTCHWPLFQLDINNAFLHEFLDEDVYILPPNGFSLARRGDVCLLKKSFYGLKQASHQWNYELTSHLCFLGFVQSPYDHYLFLHKTSEFFLILIVYVDDMLLTESSEAALLHVKNSLHDAFAIKNLGHAKYFLGVEIARSTDGIHLHQHKYISNIVSDLGLSKAKITSTPFPLGLSSPKRKAAT